MRNVAVSPTAPPILPVISAGRSLRQHDLVEAHLDFIVYRGPIFRAEVILKGHKELAAQSRPGGWNAWVTLAIQNGEGIRRGP
jgi:hypothetical protein